MPIQLNQSFYRWWVNVCEAINKTRINCQFKFIPRKWVLPICDETVMLDFHTIVFIVSALMYLTRLSLCNKINYEQELQLENSNAGITKGPSLVTLWLGFWVFSFMEVATWVTEWGQVHVCVHACVLQWVSESASNVDNSEICSIG